MKRFELKNGRRLMALLASGIVLTTLCGCRKNVKDKNITVSQYEQQADNFNLLKDKNKIVVKIKNETGGERYYLADVMNMCELSTGEFIDSKNYHKYLLADKIPASETYLYFDIFTGELLSIKYIDKETNIFKADNIVDIKFYINQISDENTAYDYAVSYIGEKDKYTKDELTEMLYQINADRKQKVFNN